MQLYFRVLRPMPVTRHPRYFFIFISLVQAIDSELTVNDAMLAETIDTGHKDAAS